MTSRRFFLSIVSLILMANFAQAGRLPPPQRSPERQRQENQRERDERDRQRREAEERGRSMPPPDMSIDVPTYAGSGCPQDSVALVKSADNKALSVLFDQFIFDGSASNNGVTSKCQLQIPIRISNGQYRLKILAVDLRGAVQIDDPAIKGVIRARSWLQTPRINARLPTPMAIERQNFQGPIDNVFSIRLEGNENAYMYTGCTDNFTLNVTTEIGLNAGRTAATSGLIAIDSLDQDVQKGGLVYKVDWERCL